MPPMTDTPEGAGTETFASISDAARAYAGITEDENPVTDTPEPQEAADAQPEQGNDDDQPASEDDDEIEVDGDDDGHAPAEEPDGPEPKKAGLVADDAKVKLDDGTEITIAELKKGTLRQADYTRKMQAFAEEKKAIEASTEQVKSLQAQLQKEHELLTTVAETFVPKPPSMEMLNERSDLYDPIGYQTQKAFYDNMMGRLSAAFASKKQRDEQAKAQESERSKQRRTSEWKALTEKVPAFADPKTGQPTEAYRKFWQDAVSAAPEYGLEPQDLEGINKHGYYLVLKDALAYRRAKAKKAEARAKGEGKPPVVTGSRRRDVVDDRRHSASTAMERLKKTGSLRDGVAALVALEKG